MDPPFDEGDHSSRDHVGVPGTLDRLVHRGLEEVFSDRNQDLAEGVPSRRLRSRRERDATNRRQHRLAGSQVGVMTVGDTGRNGVLPTDSVELVSGHVPMDRVRDFLGSAPAEVMQVLDEQDLTPAGPPFGRWEPRVDGFDAEAGFPSTGLVPPAGRVRPQMLPGGLAATAIHRGDYAAVGATYGLLENWIARSRCMVTGKPWECFFQRSGHTRAQNAGLPALRAGAEGVAVEKRVLVAYASRMGSTKEIAEEVGAELRTRGLEVDVLPCSSDPKPRQLRCGHHRQRALHQALGQSGKLVPEAVRACSAGAVDLALSERSLRGGCRDRAARSAQGRG